MKTAHNGISKQPYEQLEEAWAKYIGTQEAVAVSSGTAGLHLALKALGVGPGDEVIVPDFGMIAAAWAVTYCGAKPVFADCRHENFDVDGGEIKKKITPKTKAIIIEHLYGRPVYETIPIIGLGYPVIEDACEAHGAEIVGRKVGSFGALAVFSLYRNKIIQSEEGGLVNTNYDDLADEIRDLKSMAFGLQHDYYHRTIGFNYRMTNMQALCALNELDFIDMHLLGRKEWAGRLDQHLGRFVIPRPAGSVIWVYDMVMENESQRDRVLEALKKNGIEARPFFKPMSTQPMYAGAEVEVGKNALKFSQRGLYLCYQKKWKKRDVDLTIKIIKQSL